MSIFARSAVIVVAAKDAPSIIKRNAHYVCSGERDDVVINKAIQAGKTQNGDVGCTIELSPGAFNIRGPINLDQGIYVRGQGMAATYVSAEIGYPGDLFRFRSTPKFQSAAVGGSSNTIQFSGDQRSKISVGDVIRVQRGACYGQKRTVSAVSYGSGITTVTVSANWSGTPDTTSQCIIPSQSRLFFGVGWLYAAGRRSRTGVSLNDAYIGTVHANQTQDGTLIDSAGRAFPSWVIGCSVHIYSGSGRYETRFIEGIATTYSSNDTLLLDGPWWTAPANSSYVIGGHGLAMYGGAGTPFDVQLDHVWFTQCTGYGVYTEDAWGHCYYDLICEFDDLGGLHVTQSPQQTATTSGAWGSTTGQQAVAGPKIAVSKIVANGPDLAGAYTRGGHGIILFGRVYDTHITNCELGSSISTMHGLAAVGGLGGSVRKVCVVGCRFGSFEAQDGGSPTNAGVYLESALEATITGNIITATAIGPRYGLRMASGAQQNVVVGNQWYHSGGMQFVSDATGWNLYRGNLSNSTAEQTEFVGTVSAAANANKEVTLTYPAALITTPAATDWIVTFAPADSTTAGVSGWYVKAVSNTAVTIASANAVSGTTYTFHVQIFPECRRTGNA